MLFQKLFFTLSYILAAAPVFAAGGFTWGSSILGFLESPLAGMGIDPAPVLDLLIWGAVLIAFAFFAGRPFREGIREPDGKTDIYHLAEVIVGGILSFLQGIIKHGTGARPLVPLLGTYLLYIFILNFSGLLPGFNPPTDQFNVTIAFAMIIFVVTHFLGIRRHGKGYIKQFLGPMPVLAPLMLPIEIISHLVRPMSLSIRLFGNMTGDHKVLVIFSSILAVGLPVPFLGLGLLVSVLQAFVFVLLSAIYFEQAMSEAH